MEQERAKEFYSKWSKENPHNAGDAIKFATDFTKELTEENERLKHLLSIIEDTAGLQLYLSQLELEITALKAENERLKKAQCSLIAKRHLQPHELVLAKKENTSLKAELKNKDELIDKVRKKAITMRDLAKQTEQWHLIESTCEAFLELLNNKDEQTK